MAFCAKKIVWHNIPDTLCMSVVIVLAWEVFMGKNNLVPEFMLGLLRWVGTRRLASGILLAVKGICEAVGEIM